MAKDKKTTKVTAMIPDAVLAELKAHAPARTLTESLIKALEDWISTCKLRDLNAEVRKTAFEFIEGYNAENIRELNRRTRY